MTAIMGLFYQIIPLSTVISTDFHLAIALVRITLVRVGRPAGGGETVGIGAYYKPFQFAEIRL
jgi:hypothetical protein